MSDKVIKAIVCPGCGELSKAEIHTSINPARDKTIRKRVLDGELFAVSYTHLTLPTIA